MIERTERLEEGDECPNCRKERYGILDAICRAKAGNLMCRYCGGTFDSNSNEVDAEANEVSERT